MKRVSMMLVGLLSACSTADAQPTPPTQPQPPITDVSPGPADSAGTSAPGADPSINESWLGEDLDPLVGRLEDETREIFLHRKQIVELVAPAKGQTVADIGAGSGFMSLLFAEAVGPEGRVVSVDINEKMLERLEGLARDAGAENLETRQATQAAAPLEPNSVDLVFICDTYHHFESPTPTMKSVRAALRDDGQLVVIDFERIPGVTSDRMLQHVRAGKDVFRQEIVDAGFELVTEHEVPELEENYVLRFAKAR